MLQKLSRFFVPKRLIVVLVLLAVLAGGILLFCRNPSGSAQDFDLNRAVSNLSGSFSADLQMRLADFEARAAFQQSYIGDCTFQFTSPPSLDGFCVSVQDGQVSLSYKGLDCSVPSDELFQQSGAGMFLEVLQSLSSGQNIETQQQEDDGTVLLTFPLIENGSSCTVQLDPSTLAILRADIPEQDCSFILSNFVLGQAASSEKAA